MILSRLEIAFGEFLRQKDPSFVTRSLRNCLTPFGYAYLLCIRTRNWLFDKKFFKQKRCYLPVVSVGNVVAGGTGKTPLTLLLAETLSRICKVAILSRGYRSGAEKAAEPLLLSRGNGPLHGVEVCGDEAYLLASRVPNAIVVVGKNRFAAAQKAKEEGAELLILDDGMQHRKLFRDIEIAVVNGLNPFGGGYFLPRGFLRDEPKRLRQADLIVINGGEHSIALPGNGPTVKMRNQPIALLDEKGNTIPTLEGVKVAIFCGIAEPSRFVATVESLGAHIVLKQFLADHEKMQEKQLKRFVGIAQKKGAEWVLCTEKDWVKLAEKKETIIPFAWVKTELFVEENSQPWGDLLERIKNLVIESRKSSYAHLKHSNNEHE